MLQVGPYAPLVRGMEPSDRKPNRLRRGTLERVGDEQRWNSQMSNTGQFI